MLDVTRCNKLIVYGGSFDPPHRAHTTLPFSVADAIGADGVLFIPAGQPPHKPDRRLASAEDRLAMLRLALGDNERAAIDTMEIERAGPSFTVDTLEALRDRLGDGIELRLLMGADMMVTFYQWMRPQRIIELAEPVVMARPPWDTRAMLAGLPHDLPDGERAAWAQRIVPVGKLDIASTELRRRLSEGDYESDTVVDALDPAMIEYARDRRLYRAD